MEEEKMRLYYQIKYSEKKLELKLLELGYSLHPARLVPALISQWTRPLIAELKLRLRDMIFHRKKRSKRGGKDS